jgi:hypothetical protein
MTTDHINDLCDNQDNSMRYMQAMKHAAMMKMLRGAYTDGQLITQVTSQADYQYIRFLTPTSHRAMNLKQSLQCDTIKARTHS